MDKKHLPPPDVMMSVDVQVGGGRAVSSACLKRGTWNAEAARLGGVRACAQCLTRLPPLPAP